MVDITEKAETVREATAKGTVRMRPATLELIKSGRIGKGDVLGVAQVAGVMAAKQTPSLIPMCHPIHITGVELDFEVDDEAAAVHIAATVRCRDKTGAEMEALTAVAVAALTIYDMCKAADKAMRIESVRLIRKSGGRSGSIELE